MARLMIVHRSKVPLAYLHDFGNGGDGLPVGWGGGDSGADVNFVLSANTKRRVEIRGAALI